MSCTAQTDEIVDYLILGAGWTSQFLVPRIEAENKTYALTTTSGKPRKCCEGKYDTSKIIDFDFDPESTDDRPFYKLPTAHFIIITFPLKGAGQSKKLVETYQKIHAGSVVTAWIQLGSTGIFEKKAYHNHQSEYTRTERAIAEDELLGLGGVVLNLAGLWGDDRKPRNWVSRIAKSKEQLGTKGSLHLIHGDDVARACLAVCKMFAGNDRWIVTDKHVYDWWELIDRWADELETVEVGGNKPEYKKWVAELMDESGIMALPRNHETLGRVLDSTAFWKEYQIQPKHVLDGKGG